MSIEPTSDSFICCISRELMVDPVICSDGHTYDRKNIQKWLEISSRSPKTNLILSNKTLIPNLAIRYLIRGNGFETG